MLVVISGVNGFSGKYLCNYLLKNPNVSEVVGIDIDIDPFINQIEYFKLSDFNRFENYLINCIEDIYFFHLGGLIGHFPLNELIEANVYWTSKYLEMASKLKNLKFFLNIGSSAEYGAQSVKVLSEELKPSPVNNYGVSKSLQSDLLFKYCKVNRIPFASTRTFNLIGPGLGDNLVIGKLIKEFNTIAEGKKEYLEMGRVDSLRDFIDVRDAIKIYCSIAFSNKANGKIINVAKGQSHKIEEIINICKTIYNVDPKHNESYKVPKNQDLDQQFAQIIEMKNFIGDFKFISLHQSLVDMKNYAEE